LPPGNFSGDFYLEAGILKGWIVYMLRCADGSLYTGVTNDLARRIATHRAGKGAAYTRSRLPVRLVYTERRASRGAAQSREAAIKRLPRRAKLSLTRGTA
jgi:putative endonuclease